MYVFMYVCMYICDANYCCLIYLMLLSSCCSKLNVLMRAQSPALPAAFRESELADGSIGRVKVRPTSDT